jgi:hypothetical protein
MDRSGCLIAGAISMQEFHFPNWVNKFTVLLLVGLVLGAGYLATVLYAAALPTTVNVGHRPMQPVQYSHRLHAGDLKIDCRYCHNTVETAAHAAIPATETCGNCHGGPRVTGTDLGVVRPDSELLKPVRESLETNDPILWVKVHNTPDFVYFNHSAHVTRGVSCVECHGRIDKMEVVEQVQPLSMAWCLDCHRNPESRIRDPELVTQLDFQPPEGQSWEEYGREWAKKLNIKPNDSCSTCHR